MDGGAGAGSGRDGRVEILVSAPVPNQSLNLDGTNDYITASGVADALASASAFTMEAWVYPTRASGQQGITTFHTSTGNNRNLLLYRSGQFQYFDGDTGYVASRNAFPAGQWYHVALTVDASNTAILYVNGRREATLNTSVRPEAGGLFSIGQEWDGGPTASDFFEGRIDEVRIWSQARTQAQLQQGMTTSLGTDNTLDDTFDLSDLVAHYRFEGNLLDETGAYAGTAEGAPTYTDDVAQTTAEDALIVRVNTAVSGGGAGNGTSWTDAHAALQDGVAGTGPENQIWIAAGTYTPTRRLDAGDPRTATFEITGAQDGLQIYGGFDGTETTRSERAPSANEVILSGDIGTAGDSSDNAYHVLVFNGGDRIGANSPGNITTGTVLDGLTITSGNAANSFPNNAGGGLYCDGVGSGNACSPSLTGLTFTDNSAGAGGAIYNEGFNNGASSPVITNATFTGNTADLNGGAIYNNGASGTSSPMITNATFTGNTADLNGGAIGNNGIVGTSSPQITNTILWGNTATNDGDEIYNDDATPTLAHTLIEGGLGGISESGGSFTTDGGNNLDAEPLFVDANDPAGPDNAFGTADDGLRVAANSPAVDAGDTGALPTDAADLDGDGDTTEPLPLDIAGAPRIQDGDSDGTATVSLGAYETSGLPIATSVTITGTDGTGTDAGWRVLSVPYTGAVAGDLRMSSSTGTNALRFNRNIAAVWDDSDSDESTGGTGAYTTVDASTPLDLGAGLLLYLEDDVRDPVESGGLAISLDESTTATRQGLQAVVRNDLTQSARWHLVGNPYPTDYDLMALTTGGSPLAGNGFQADVQVYDATNSTWQILSVGTETLAAWQGAFIERSSPGNGPTTVTFDPGGRTAPNAPFIGSEMQGPVATSSVERGTLWLEGVVTDAAGTVVATDQAIGVRFHESATDGWDAWDTSKLAPLEAPSLALSATGTGRGNTGASKAVESRPWPQDASDPDANLTAVPVAIRGNGLPDDGTLTLQVREWDLPDTWAAGLIDTQGTSDTSDDQAVPLEPGMNYTVDVSSLTDTPETERFVVQVAPNTGALPVELAGFGAQRSGEDAITVQWETLSETNNAGFEVQRRAASADGPANASVETSQWGVSTTGESWQTVATLDGAGTTGTPQSYRFEDTDLPYAADSLRYRLRQIDTDGTESFSEAVTIVRQVTEAELLPTYPNPARGQATVRFAVPERQDVRIDLYDLLGRRVQTVVDTGAEGRTEAQLDVSGLASGTYFLRMQTEAGPIDTQRVTVVR
ncbi:hypothetical protein CRI93_11480 [Longimonas halophila]|uniref:LamG-like jellyroll fold domain-containing protein n=2 Tax=Longimonas halophila TaxID=1469170 RepID=A0A2H3NJ84_9BACT|nr:hypothetical protein CRI93_11480 [Longimonas halophila]